MYKKATFPLGCILAALIIFTGTITAATGNMIFANPPPMMMDNSSGKYMGKMNMAMKMSPMMCMDARDAMQMMMSKKMGGKDMMMGDNMSLMMGDNMSMMMDKPMMMMCMDADDVMIMKMMKHMKTGENGSSMMMMGNRSMMWEN